MSNLTNWRSNMLTQQQQLAQQQLAQQQLLAKQQLAQQEQLELQKKHDSLVSQIFNITNSTVNINGPSHCVCDHVTVAGGNNHITTTNHVTNPIGGVLLKYINYGIQNNMPNGSLGTCNVRWNGTGNTYNGPINSGGSVSGNTVYADSNTLTMLFTDASNQGWNYEAAFTYSNTGNPSVSFTGTPIGYAPIEMRIQIPSLNVDSTISVNENNGQYIQLSGNTIPDGGTWNITFNPVVIQPISVVFQTTNITPYDLTFNGLLVKANTLTPVVLSSQNNIQYDVNSPIQNNFGFNWAGTPNNILTNGTVMFNACPSTGLPVFSIDMGKEISIFNYNDISVTVKLYDMVTENVILPSTLITVGQGQQNLLFSSDIINYINTYSGGILIVSLSFAANTQLPLINNFVFTNNTPYAITITPGDCVSSSVNPIPSTSTGTWTETIQPNDNYLNPPVKHIISWTNNPGSSSSYSGTCTTTLDTLDNGSIVCSLANVDNSGITTTLSYNNTPIVADQYGNLAVLQSNMILPPTAVPNTYEIILTAAALTNCVFSLNVTNSCSNQIIDGYYFGIYNANPTLSPLNLNGQLFTVLNGTTLQINLVWGGPSWGGPSIIQVKCNNDGTGEILIVDRGVFDTSVSIPTMVANPGQNPPFTTIGANDNPPRIFSTNLPATGGVISLAFSDPSSNL